MNIFRRECDNFSFIKCISLFIPDTGICASSFDLVNVKDCSLLKCSDCVIATSLYYGSGLFCSDRWPFPWGSNSAANTRICKKNSFCLILLLIHTLQIFKKNINPIDLFNNKFKMFSSWTYNFGSERRAIGRNRVKDDSTRRKWYSTRIADKGIAERKRI